MSWHRSTFNQARTHEHINVLSPLRRQKNSAFFEEYLRRLLEERNAAGLTAMIDEIDAIMITVDPGHSVRYIGELALMTPYHYLLTLEC